MNGLDILKGIAGFNVGGTAGAIVSTGNAGRVARGAGRGIASGWRALTGQTNFDADFFDYDPEQLARQGYERVSDPRFGAAQFERMAANASTGAAALQRLARSRRGSVAQGTALAEAEAARTRNDVFEQYGQFRLGAERTAQGYLDLDARRREFMLSGLAQQSFQNSQNRAGFFNQLLSIGASALGGGVG
ncbi:MAG: hypothetical protein AAGF99_00490 [Bacteroidota bacterium]